MTNQILKSVKEFAMMAGVSHQAVYDLMKKKVLPYTVILGRKAIDLNNSQIKDYMNNNRGFELPF